MNFALLWTSCIFRQLHLAQRRVEPATEKLENSNTWKRLQEQIEIENKRLNLPF